MEPWPAEGYAPGMLVWLDPEGLRAGLGERVRTYRFSTPLGIGVLLLEDEDAATVSWAAMEVSMGVGT